MKTLLDSSPIAKLLQEGHAVVNGVDQRSAVDLVFQAVDRGSGRQPDIQAETSEQAEQDILAVEVHPAGLAPLHTKKKRSQHSQSAPLLPPECQGAACHARAALAAFASACAADRKCREVFSTKVKGQETQVGQVTHQATS